MTPITFATAIPINSADRFAIGDQMRAYATTNFPGRRCAIMLVGAPNGGGCIVSGEFERLADATMFKSAWQGVV